MNICFLIEKKVFTNNNLPPPSIVDTSNYFNSIKNQLIYYLEPPLILNSIPTNPKPILNGTKLNFQININIIYFLGGSHRPERYTPNEVATFIRSIDPSFDSLASRFLQEVFLIKFLKQIRTFNLILYRKLMEKLFSF